MISIIKIDKSLSLLDNFGYKYKLINILNYWI
jgi:hypothetical protein